MSNNEKSKIAEIEEKILNFWNENNIFQKSLLKNKDKEDFVFFDGPPFATGLPHYGHLLPGTMKDIIPRYKTMRGYNVERRWGWDCHGLPVENLIEKELGVSNKQEIEEYGIEKFNRAARESVLRYEDEWKTTIPRTGRWIGRIRVWIQSLQNLYGGDLRQHMIKGLHMKDLNLCTCVQDVVLHFQTLK